MKGIQIAAVAALTALAVQGIALAQDAQPSNGLIAPPPPVVTRPGGDGNVSQYEYAPEKQPTWQYSAPGSTEDACSAENALLRDQVRDMQTQTMQLEAEIADLKARNQALQKATASK